MTDFDFAVIGAGIAGASLAAGLARQARVVMLEAESSAGYHATGRSAAFWDETYGGPEVQPLTTASGPFFSHPPTGFSDHPLMSTRGVLYIGREQDRPDLNELVRDFATSGVRLEAYEAADVARKIPGIKAEWQNGIFGPDCADIDVAALHQGWLNDARRSGVDLRCNARLISARRQGLHWEIETSSGALRAASIVNAAGAWADSVAIACGVRPLGITPFRRTIVQLRMAAPVPRTLPLVIGIGGDFYFKPEGDGLWLSPHDETPSLPCDAAPEEIDVAHAIARLEQVVDWRVATVTRKWAGLRSFAPDRLPVYGYDPREPSWFWFAGQGGFGIQTAPAAASLATALALETSPSPMVSAIDFERYSPARFKL